MLFYYTLFLFIAFGSKLLLALLMIYMLLPTERSCNSCDGETLLIRPGGAAALGSRLTGGRLQQRWCPRCEWYGIARRAAAAPPAATGRGGGAPRDRRGRAPRGS